MPKSTKTTVAKKPRGRPSIGAEVLMGVKVPAEFARQFEEWAAKRGLTKSAAMRQILEKAIKAE